MAARVRTCRLSRFRCSACSCFAKYAREVKGDFIVRLLEKVGVSKDRVSVERESRNTLENAAFAKELWTLPHSLMGGIGITDLAVHEWIGLLAYWITGRISEPLPGPMAESHHRRLTPQAPAATD